MRKDSDLKPGSRTGWEWGAFNHVVPILGDQLQPWSTLRPSPGTSSPPAVRPSKRILIDHLQAPDTLTTVFFPGGLQLPTLSTALGTGGKGSGHLMASDSPPLTLSILVDYE